MQQAQKVDLQWDVWLIAADPRHYTAPSLIGTTMRQTDGNSRLFVKSKSTHNVVGNSKSVDEGRKIVNSLFLAIGISWESFLKHRLSLLDLPDEVLKALQQGQIAYTKAQAIARIKDEDQRGALLSKAIDEGLSLS
jgi:HTH domain found in ParB protein